MKFLVQFMNEKILVLNFFIKLLSHLKKKI